jgi:hypothetical protein
VGIGIFCAGLVLLPVIIYANRIKTSLRQRKIQHKIWGGKNVVKNRNVKRRETTLRRKRKMNLR